MGQREGCNKHKGKGISSVFFLIFSKHIYTWVLYSFLFKLLTISLRFHSRTIRKIESFGVAIEKH